MNKAPRSNRLAPRATLLALAAAVGAACAQAQSAATCAVETFTRFDLPGTRIVSAAAVDADTRAGAHCVVRGAVNERTPTVGGSIRAASGPLRKCG